MPHSSPATSNPPDRLLTPAIAEAGRAWSNLASRWGDLTAPRCSSRPRPDAHGRRSSCRLPRAHPRHQHHGQPRRHRHQARPRARHPRATLHALESSSELAYVVSEKANVPGLTGPARALSVRAHNDIEAGLAASRFEGDVVWISPEETSRTQDRACSSSRRRKPAHRQPCNGRVLQPREHCVPRLRWRPGNSLPERCPSHVLPSRVDEGRLGWRPRRKGPSTSALAGPMTRLRRFGSHRHATTRDDRTPA